MLFGGPDKALAVLHPDAEDCESTLAVLSDNPRSSQSGHFRLCNGRLLAVYH